MFFRQVLPFLSGAGAGCLGGWVFTGDAAGFAVVVVSFRRRVKAKNVCPFLEHFNFEKV